MIRLTNKHSVPVVATLLFALSFGTTMNAYAQGGFWDWFGDKVKGAIYAEVWPNCSTQGNTTGIPCSDSGPGGNAGGGSGSQVSNCESCCEEDCRAGSSADTQCKDCCDNYNNGDPNGPAHCSGSAHGN